MSLPLIPIGAKIRPQSIDELREVLTARHVQLTIEGMQRLNLAECAEFDYT